MYQISDKEFALEMGDEISFVKDGGGKMFVHTSNLDITTKAERIIIYAPKDFTLC